MYPKTFIILVTVEDMEHNGNMIIGQYNFTDLEVGIHGIYRRSIGFRSILRHFFVTILILIRRSTPRDWHLALIFSTTACTFRR